LERVKGIEPSQKSEKARDKRSSRDIAKARYLD